MQFIINTPSSPSLSSTLWSDDLELIHDATLFAPSPPPHSHLSQSPTPAHKAVVPDTPAPLYAVVSPVIVTLNNKVLMQDATQEPEIVAINSGRYQGQLRKKKGFLYSRKSVLLTYPNHDAKPTMAALYAEFDKHCYRLRERLDYLERYKATRDAKGEVVAEGTWHMNIFGHLCLHQRGDPPNIKNERAFDITIGRDVCHVNIHPPRNQADGW